MEINLIGGSHDRITELSPADKDLILSGDSGVDSAVTQTIGLLNAPSDTQ